MIVMPESAATSPYPKLESLGTQAAQRMWDRILRHDYPASLIPELIEDECDVLRIVLTDMGTSPADIPAGVDFLRLVIVREGKRLAILNAMVEGGTA